MSDTALMLVDIQRDYFPGGQFPLPEMEAAGNKAAEVLDSFRKRRLPVWHIQHIDLDASATFFLPESEGCRIHSCVAAHKDEPTIVKHFPNSFRETSLEKDLRAAGIKKLVFCGAMSNICIDASVRAAFDLGFECTVIHDACAASEMEFSAAKLSSQQVHSAFMGSLSWGFAQVVDSAAYLG